MDELAHAAGKDPYLYRRELIARTNLPYKADMIKALDTAAEMSGWGTPLPPGMARAIALEERGAETHGNATISAQVHTVSISRQGELRLLRVDVAHEEGFGLVNPLSVKKQIEGQITWFYNDTMHQAVHRRGRPHRREQLRHDSRCRASTRIRPKSTSPSSRRGIGCAAWVTTAPHRFNRASPMPFSRSPGNAIGICRSATTT